MRAERAITLSSIRTQSNLATSIYLESGHPVGHFITQFFVDGGDSLKLAARYNDDEYNSVQRARAFVIASVQD